jgi:hypothetical protein
MLPFSSVQEYSPSVCLLCRVAFRSIDYPVKWFVVVAGQQTLAGRNAIAYQVKHMLEFPQDKVGKQCSSVSRWCSSVPGGGSGCNILHCICRLPTKRVHCHSGKNLVQLWRCYITRWGSHSEASSVTDSSSH